ncbi:hypothetical protein [uncultured Sulfitobacter sp.]|uniref:hypothetical protein n=1 Tax=uncultured Sulfitobacter sp. TaxID=191468 RepID=UPI002622D87B|nr:hypothetical protein [uncultured Sulfitobacter sp.]
MGRNSYLGGGTTIIGGQWSSYDPQEVRDSHITKSPGKAGSEPAPQPPAPKSLSKATRKAAAVKARTEGLMRYAHLCAAADRTHTERPPRPADVKKTWLRHQKQRNKFEALVHSFL